MMMILRKGAQNKDASQIIANSYFGLNGLNVVRTCDLNLLFDA
jgi:hypothetical protein